MISVDYISNFPGSPGVYIMKGDDGVVLYVGKARDLKKRVRCYFGVTDSRYQIKFLMQRVASIEYIVTDTEKEALILENTLIKKHRPRYNINLRDDKTYFSLRMDMKEEFPRLNIVRKVPADGARYFGPYASATAARDVLKHLYKLFPLRHYPMESCRRRNRPCLFHQMKQCSAPCHGLITAAEYASLVEGAALFLEGKNTEVARIFRSKMNQASQEMRYEDAARFRDILRSIEQTVERQKVVARGGDSDVFGVCREAAEVQVSLLHIRGGSLTGSRSFCFSWEMETEEGLASLMNEYYAQDQPIPQEILLPIPIPEPEALEELLSDQSGKRVRILVPQRGAKLDLVKLAEKNAESAAKEKAAEEGTATKVLAELADKLNLDRPPARIECYDISNIQGEMAVGSRVVFVDGKANKALYRRYKIRTVQQSDDFGMMREVLSRRFKGGEEREAYPDLIVVDGGIGQLNVLTSVLKELEVDGVYAAGLAKSRVEREMQKVEIKRSEERVFLPGRKNPAALRPNSPAILLLARIRDEAHRFAITYHRSIRSRNIKYSELQDVPGIGEKRKKALLAHFGSLRKVKEATLEELCKVPGISGAAAKALWQSLHPEPAAANAERAEIHTTAVDVVGEIAE